MLKIISLIVSWIIAFCIGYYLNYHNQEYVSKKIEEQTKMIEQYKSSYKNLQAEFSSDKEKYCNEIVFSYKQNLSECLGAFRQATKDIEVIQSVCKKD